MVSDYYEEGTQAVKMEDYDTAIEAFKNIYTYHKRNDLTPTSYYYLGQAYFEDKQFENSISVFKNIINPTFAIGFRGSYDMGPFENFRHSSCEYLSDIHYKLGNYDSAIYYINYIDSVRISDSVMKNKFVCGNATAERALSKSIRLSKIYQKLGDIVNAEKELLYHVFGSSIVDNNEVISELKNIYLNQNRKQLQIELNKSIKNIESRKKTFRDTIEYETHFIHFHGVEILIDGFLFAKYMDTPYFSLGISKYLYDPKKASQDLKESEFYKMVELLK